MTTAHLHLIITLPNKSYQNAVFQRVNEDKHTIK